MTPSTDGPTRSVGADVKASNGSAITNPAFGKADHVLSLVCLATGCVMSARSKNVVPVTRSFLFVRLPAGLATARTGNLSFQADARSGLCVRIASQGSGESADRTTSYDQ